MYMKGDRKMIADKMKNMVANSSAIRAMFEEGTRSGQEFTDVRNVFDFSLGNPNVPAPQIVKMQLSNWSMTQIRLCFMAIRTVTVDIRK